MLAVRDKVPESVIIHSRTLNDKSPVHGEQRLERKLILHDLGEKNKRKGVKGYINRRELQ